MNLFIDSALLMKENTSATKKIDFKKTTYYEWKDSKILQNNTMRLNHRR